ncbi:MAG: lipoprotein signal peptidase [Betaproteobacteria bacterium]|nr:lipoprotein signal peptidase [Betaproteobacteria bacterium]
MPRTAIWFAVAFAVVVLDRLSKIWILEAFRPGEALAVSGFFNLVLVFNKGAAFSFLAAAPGWQTPLFVAIAVAASLLIGFLLYRNPGKTLFCIGLALILGGALGNLWDRLQWGHVVDFLDFHAAGWHWPAFNVADSAITVGAAMLIVESFLHREGNGRREKRA